MATAPHALTRPTPLPAATATLEALSPSSAPLLPTAGVVVLQWPAEAHIREQLRARGIARLLVVVPDGTYPMTDDPLEDWMFASSGDEELQRRVNALERRMSRRVSPPDPPRIDEHDLLRYADRWVALPPGEAGLMRVLLGRMDSCAPIEELAPQAGSQASLRGRIKRLRARIAPLGFTITTVRSRGFILSLGPR